jgi:hypothetical protein
MRAPAIMQPIMAAAAAGQLTMAAAGGLVMTAPTEARAEVDAGSASHIMPACHLAISGEAQDLYAQGVCIGEAVGVLDMAEAAGSICSPGTISNGQAIAEIVQYIDARPDRRSERFTALALEALRTVWPCATGDPAHGP